MYLRHRSQYYTVVSTNQNTDQLEQEMKRQLLKSYFSPSLTQRYEQLRFASHLLCRLDGGTPIAYLLPALLNVTKERRIAHHLYTVIQICNSLTTYSFLAYHQSLSFTSKSRLFNATFNGSSFVPYSVIGFSANTSPMVNAPLASFNTSPNFWMPTPSLVASRPPSVLTLTPLIVSFAPSTMVLLVVFS